MVTQRTKTSALWQQINGSLSPRISRTLNKIWHNSIILKQALGERTVSFQRQERKGAAEGRFTGCWKFLSTFWILFYTNPLWARFTFEKLITADCTVGFLCRVDFHFDLINILWFWLINTHTVVHLQTYFSSGSASLNPSLFIVFWHCLTLCL